MTLEYTLADHLGSSSLKTDKNGTLVSKILYKPFGELRYTWTSNPATAPVYALTMYTFCEAPPCGHRPVLLHGRPTTTESEGFGLMFYNARWYDPVTGRFAQADSIVPAGAQGWDRYGYVNNNPVNFSDPSGHRCAPKGECVGPAGQGEPDDVDFSQLTKTNKNRPYSGWMMYWLYMKAWEQKGGYLSIKTFATLILSHEFQPIQGVSDDFQENLKTAAGNWFWCSPNADTNACTNLRQAGTDINAGLLNWIGGMESARRLFEGGANAWDKLNNTPKNVPLATGVMNFVLNESNANGHLYLDTPFYWANKSLPLGSKSRNILDASQGLGFNQYLAAYPISLAGDPFFILTPCQTDYWRQTNTYEGCQ